MVVYVRASWYFSARTVFYVPLVVALYSALARDQLVLYFRVPSSQIRDFFWRRSAIVLRCAGGVCPELRMDVVVHTCLVWTRVGGLR